MTIYDHVINKYLVCIPVFNEELTLDKLMDKIEEWSKTTSILCKFILSNDGSTDGSLDLIKSKVKSSPLFDFVQLDVNQGYGAACRNIISYKGLQSYDWILFLDSDLTNPLTEIDKLDKFLKTNHTIDYVKFTRYSKGGMMLHVPRKRDLISRLANYLSRILTLNYVTDPTNGLRAISVKKIKEFTSIQKDFSIIMEELYLIFLKKFHVGEIGTLLDQRQSIRPESSFAYKPKLIFMYIWFAILIGLHRIKRSLNHS